MQRIQQGHDFDPGFGIQSPGRFVGKQDFRLVNQCPGDGDPLTLSAGQFGGTVIQPGFESHSLGNGCRHFESAGPGDTCISQGKGDVFQNSQISEQVELLEHKTYFAVADGGEL